MKKISITRSFRLPALHALKSPLVADTEVESVFGSCSRLHGHDYRIEVTITGPLNPQTGMLIRRDEFDKRVNLALIERFRGKNLSDYFVYTTGEALAFEFFKVLETEFDSPLTLLRVRVHETAKNSFVFQPA